MQVARDTKATATNVTAFASQMDEKYKVSEQASILAKAAKERGEVMQKSTAAAIANMNTMAKSWSSKVAENPNVRCTPNAVCHNVSVTPIMVDDQRLPLLCQDLRRYCARSRQVATTAEAMRGWGSKLGASFKTLQDSVATKLDVPAYAPQPAPSTAAKDGAAQADAAVPTLQALEAADKPPTAPVSSAAVKPENAFSLGEWRRVRFCITV